MLPRSGLQDAYEVFDQKKLKKLLRPGLRRKAGTTFITDGVQVHLHVWHDHHHRRFAMTGLPPEDSRFAGDLEIVGADPGRRDVVTVCNTSVPEGSPGRYWR